MPYIYKSGLQFGINETNIYGGTSYVELTQAEYDALSDAEKHNGQIYFITDGNYDFLIVNDSVPIGSIQAYGGMSAPTNWLICDGSAVSRTDYKELFQIIGVSFGEGDGVTTFNLPDFRGRVLTGAGSLNSISYELGQKKDAGLPNISGKAGRSYSEYNKGNTSYANLVSGPFYYNVSEEYGTPNDLGTGNGDAIRNHYFDASRVSSIYGNSTTVQPNTTVANYIIKAKNPSITSGQQSQAMKLFYPVGSYFETSDSTFDPNTEWGGTWEFENNIYRTAAWTASSSTALNTILTETIANVPSGTYIIDIAYPVLSTTPFASSIRVNGQEANKYLYQYSGSNTSIIIKLTDENNSINLGSSQSSSCNMSYLERGGLTLYNLTNSSKYKWHRTA